MQRTDFRENIKVEVVNVSKDDLLEDFEDAPEVTKAGLYKTVYTSEYGQFGGQPYAALIGNYDFGPGPQDMKLLQYVASVSAMSHTPFIVAASPTFYGVSDFNELPNLKDLKSILEVISAINEQRFLTVFGKQPEHLSSASIEQHRTHGA